MLSNLPPSAGKASALLKERPDAVKAIAVFIGAAKNAAENQFANVRAKIQKLAKGKAKADPKRHSCRAAATGDRRQGDQRRRCRPLPLRRPAPSRRSSQPQRAPSRAAGRHRRRQSVGDELCAAGQGRARAADRRAGRQACRGRRAASAEAEAEASLTPRRQATPAAKPAAAKTTPPSRSRQAATPSKPPARDTADSAAPRRCQAHARRARTGSSMLGLSATYVRPDGWARFAIDLVRVASRSRPRRRKARA